MARRFLNQKLGKRNTRRMSLQKGKLFAAPAAHGKHAGSAHPTGSKKK